MNWLLLVTVHSRHLDSCQTDMFTFTTGIKNSFAQKSHRLILTTHHNINNERNSLGIINQQVSNWDVSEADWGLVFFPQPPFRDHSDRHEARCVRVLA